MLSELQIRDYAIVDRLYLNLKEGMSVFTGETGAGKSIAIDALGIALGDRAESSVVRNGATRAEITASFDIRKNKEAQNWLREHELDEDGECILRRTINKESGSRAYINGRPVPLQRIKELAELLIDIHSQHQHQSLLRSSEQRNLLDQYGQCVEVAYQVQQAFNQWKQDCKAKAQLLSAEQDRQSRLDFLVFQLNELEKLSPIQGEWETIESEHATMANLEKIEASINESLELLYDENNAALSQINHTISSLEKVAQFNPVIVSAIDLLNSSRVNIEEAANELRSVTDDSEWNQARFEWLEERIAGYMSLSRKHHCEPGELMEIQEKLGSELEELRDADVTLEKMDLAIERSLHNYQQLADKLTAQRSKAAQKLGEEVTKHLAKLGMKGSSFQVELHSEEPATPASYGNETILFTVSTNRGQDAQAIQKIASGGELSRISLAIQVVTAKVARIPAMVFDEVDVGIGGGTAEIVGKMLRQLSKTRQILCITHQPQVASQGHQHYLVEKASKSTSTTTAFTLLDQVQRKEEIARMLGGINITLTTLEHAEEMLSLAGD